ncbi:hypothetical protein PL8927_720296 [Planktothrix serta PCC 8927]|uniref:Uncharacterized protein n=1 Tax=Planktothrix serta PCC 8927 TaxID=671068 RepID=A0A7Z9BV01_9CYAN|nr:hypothetical protein [Planktothrix serta]VXD21933.1 hypothetical protein PL8927_720296 [Planktothrix serta PCC 8927]
MANRLFLENQLREKFLSQNVKEFNLAGIFGFSVQTESILVN